VDGDHRGDWRAVWGGGVSGPLWISPERAGAGKNRAGGRGRPGCPRAPGGGERVGAVDGGRRESQLTIDNAFYITTLRFIDRGSYGEYNLTE